MKCSALKEGSGLGFKGAARASVALAGTILAGTFFAGAAFAGTPPASATHAGVTHAGVTRPTPATGTVAGVVTVRKYRVQNNPTGISAGFYEDKYDDETLQAFGHRPSMRTNFDAWSRIDNGRCLTPAQWDSFDWTDFFANGPGRNYIEAHRRGQTVYGAINVTFSAQTNANSGKQTIPSCYPQYITDPGTRTAALAFVRSYTRAMLRNVGNFAMTIDYEIIYNYQLSDGASIVAGRTYDQRANDWAAWYVDAANAARGAQRTLENQTGKSYALQLLPIVNADPMDPDNPLSQPSNRTRTNWLRRVVNASDALGIDSYYRNPLARNIPADRSDPQYTIAILQHWIRYYASDAQMGYDRPAIVTENGFKPLPPSMLDANGNVTDALWKQGKYVGTAADQDRYYLNLFPLLMSENTVGGKLGGKLRGYHIWSVMDNYLKDASDSDRYFGLLYRPDETQPAYAERPSASTVRAALSVLETAGSSSAPTKPAVWDTIERAADLKAGTASVPMNISSGNDYDLVRYATSSLAPDANGYTLNVVLTRPAPILVNANGRWYYDAAASVHAVRLSGLRDGAANTIDVVATGDAFPAQAVMTKLTLTAN